MCFLSVGETVNQAAALQLLGTIFEDLDEELH